MSSPKNSARTGQLRLPGKQIENSAADGELAARRDLRDSFVTGSTKRFDRCLHRFALCRA